MTRDILETLFASHVPSLAGMRRQKDAYHWLEDSDEGSEVSDDHSGGFEFTFAPETSTPTLTDINTNHGLDSINFIDLTNSNGKRASPEPTPSSHQRQIKKMRVDCEAQEVATSSGQVSPAARPITIDLSGSPPPAHRTGDQSTQQQTRPSQSSSTTRDPVVPRTDDNAEVTRAHDMFSTVKVHQT